MGSQLSHPKLSPPQWDIYLQVLGTLLMRNFKFLKGELKIFVHWVLKHFRNTVPFGMIWGESCTVFSQVEIFLLQNFFLCFI